MTIESCISFCTVQGDFVFAGVEFGVSALVFCCDRRTALGPEDALAQTETDLCLIVICRLNAVSPPALCPRCVSFARCLLFVFFPCPFSLLHLARPRASSRLDDTSQCNHFHIPTEPHNPPRRYLTTRTLPIDLDTDTT